MRELLSQKQSTSSSNQNIELLIPPTDLNKSLDNDDSSLVEIDKMICPLCFRFICKCVTTFCGHSYCEMCFDEY